MKYEIDDIACCYCGNCACECPVGAITYGEYKYYINNNVCDGCGICTVFCPVGAINPA